MKRATMSDFKDKKSGEEGKTVLQIEHPECDISIRDGKAVLSKKTVRTYKVSVTYVKLSEEQEKSKRGIIENIIKKSHKN